MAKIDAKPIKVVVTGPESSGKSTLSEALAQYFNMDFVPEFAREYLLKTDGRYQKEDLVVIARGQIKLEDEATSAHPQLLICDTSLEVIRVWSEWKFGHCDPFILDQAKRRTPHLYLLLKPDIPWQDDPLRENPNDRNDLFNKYYEILTDYDTQITIIEGNSENRFKTALKAIKKLI